MCTLLTQTFCLMCHTQYLQLGGNRIGDAGLTALAKAVESGALAKCTYISLAGNQIGDAGLSAFAGALSSGVLASLEKLYLYSNAIGDDGMSALASACASGALDHLTVCWRPTALSPCPETSHAHSSDSDVLFDVQYAGVLARQQ